MSTEVKRVVKRAIAAFTALSLGTTLTLTSLLMPAIVHAYTALGGQVQSRAIYMSKSTPSATSQSYQVTFIPASTTSLKGIILDFCAGSPIIGDSTCVKPTGFDMTVTPTVTMSATTAGTNSAVTTTGLPGTWTAAGLNNSSGYRTLKLTSSAGSGALSTSTLYNFTITTITNPSTTGTFYARLLTYNLDTGDVGSYAPGTEGTTNLIDYGGFALSTVSNISITAKVQESLTFCTSAADLSGASSNTCASATTPTLTLGHGSPAPGVLDNTAVDRATAYTQASTNATSGLAIRMHATNSCTNAGLSANGGSTCNINGMPTTSGIPAQVLTAGTTAFGLYVSNSATTSGVGTSTGTITPNGNYHDAAHTNEGTGDLYYGMNQTANSGVVSTYGDAIASSSAPVSQINNHLVFGATAGLTVPAGIYTGSESLIATGTF